MATMGLNIRALIHGALTSKAGDTLAPIRIGKDLARRANVVLGKPLATQDEIEKRKAARTRLAALRGAQMTQDGERVRSARYSAAGHTDTARVAAPVVVYRLGDRNVRELARIRELLTSKAIAFSEVDLFGDEPGLSFALTKSGRKDDDLPFVFVTDQCVGTYNELVDAEVQGSLHRLVWGEEKPRVTTKSAQA